MVDPNKTLPGTDMPLLPWIEAYKPGIDKTLIVENLKLTPTQRVEKLQRLVEFCHELRTAKQIDAP